MASGRRAWEANERARGNRAAREVAKLVYTTELYRVRWGAFFEPVRGCVIAFDNLPWTWDPGRRDLVLEAFRAYLDGVGLRELGAATWPLAGPDESRTLVMLVEGTPRDVARIKHAQTWCALQPTRRPPNAPLH